MRIFRFYQFASVLLENILANRIIMKIAGYYSCQLTLLAASLCLFIIPIVPACAET